ncbi:ABC transporter permease [Halorubrum ezzemoulense]|uniref:ABC transporter permease n=1 Tax=Halorubrum ezzemoulense TaxID=337243 RepID=UPI00232D9E40|nr:ABC transporter permease [Halorubrum ezzemoulense]MDB9249356.1 ABC transporter permease [Halorubrum ezzemoulense]MDB9257576.1 ABC transporter permease [Halorubrum ezzemoulense]MDB9262061.1 ABC transporter permease [Halorubrum ezzemoulense]MDB9265564.1 ABC transporter permease [Halorubrum ezzemoulense]MDB9267937.1 ABC transporter permease [Halorubrum ezzemoulense]
MSWLRRILAVGWIAARQLRSDRTRTLFAVLGVTLAVLSVTLLAGVGAGVAETGSEAFEQSGRDLWVSGGPIEVSPGAVGGFQNPISDAHALSSEIGSHEDVKLASPLAFQVVYVSPDGEEFDTIMGSGVPGASQASLSFSSGEGFVGDPHYADGEYTGEMTYEAIVSPEMAIKYDLEVGDTVHVGGTLQTAREHEYEVVGISPTFENFLGTGTVTIPLAEFQTLTGNAYDDRATIVTVQLVDGADPEAVREDLAARHPSYTFRTNEEQLVETVERQAVILAAGTSLVALGVVAGGALALNLLLSIVYVQRETLSVLRAVGITRLGVIGVAVVQALAIASLGYLLGAGATPALAAVIDRAAFAVTGFEGLVRVPGYAYAAGAAVAFGFALLGGVIGAIRVTRFTATNEFLQ